MKNENGLIKREDCVTIRPSQVEGVSIVVRAGIC